MVEPMRIPVLAGDLGTFDFEAKEGKIFVNGVQVHRDAIRAIGEAVHLVMVQSDLQEAALRRASTGGTR